MPKFPGTHYDVLELPADPPGINDPCWCRSGSNYGACHLDRHLQVPESKWEILRKVRKLHQAEYCSHPSASPTTCAGGIIRAHSLQRSGALSAIAVNGHVYGLDPFAEPSVDGQPRYIRIGLRRASTFTGFCEFHDAQLFRPIELEPFRATKEQLFLLAYRALSKEVYAKRFAIRMVPILRKGDVGRGSLEQVGLQQYLYIREQVLRYSLRDLESSFSDYQAAYLSGDYDRFSAYVIFSDREPDFAVSGGIHPEFDFHGASLQDLSSPGVLDFAAYSVLPLQSGGAMALIWDSESATSSQKLASSLHKLDVSGVPDALVRFSYEHFENCFASPIWWEGLQEAQRKNLLQRIALSASSEAIRMPDCLKDDGLRTARWKVVAREWL
jgi:SEC-C motif